MIQPIFNQLKLVVTAFVLTMGIVSSLSMGSINTQAAANYTCPVGSALNGVNCVASNKVAKTLCSDLSAPDANGNCKQSQSALFSCDGRPGQIVILENSGTMSNNTRGTTLCTTRTNLFNRTEARSEKCSRTDYMLNPVDGRWMNEYTMLANENNQARETQYCQNGIRVCPVGQRLFYYPAGTFNRFLPNTGIACVIESFNFRANGLLPTAYSRSGADIGAECDSSIYDVISIWDWNGGDSEDNRICAKKSYKATVQAGTASTCPAGWGDLGGVNCFKAATLVSNSPDGWLDGISNAGVASGWATDADAINASLDVHFYIDGSTSSMGTYIGKTTASYVRPDLPAPYNTGKNGYDFKLPKAYCDSKPHTLYAYGIDAPSFVSNPLLSGSPKSFILSETQCGYGTTTTTTITKDPVTLTDLTDGSVKIICNGGKELLVNSKATCIFDIGDKTLPDGTNIAIGNGDISSSTCKAVGAAVNCTNVSTGTLTGDQPIMVKIGNGVKTDTNQKVKVVAVAVVTPVTTTTTVVTTDDFNPKTDNGSGASNGSTIKVTCNDGKEVLINSTATCTFDIGNKTLPENTKITIGNGDINTSTCAVNGSKVTCTNVSTGSEAGDQPLYIKIGNGQKVNTNQKVKVSGDSSVTGTLVRSGAGTAVAGTIGTMAMAGAGFFLYKKKTARNAKLNI